MNTEIKSAKPTVDDSTRSAQHTLINRMSLVLQIDPFALSDVSPFVARELEELDTQIQRLRRKMMRNQGRAPMPLTTFPGDVLNRQEVNAFVAQALLLQDNQNRPEEDDEKPKPVAPETGLATSDITVPCPTTRFPVVETFYRTWYCKVHNDARKVRVVVYVRLNATTYACANAIWNLDEPLEMWWTNDMRRRLRSTAVCRLRKHSLVVTIPENKQAKVSGSRRALREYLVQQLAVAGAKRNE
jgi:hypothetical protein